MMDLRATWWRIVKNVYLRVTLSPSTTLFFLLSFISAFVLSLTQSFTYTIDSSSTSFVNGILNTAGNPQNNEFAVLLKNGTLQHCSATPIEKHTSPCFDVYSPGNVTVPPTHTCSGTELFATSNPMSFERSEDSSVVITSGSCSITLTSQCISTLVYPSQVLENQRREDLSLVGSQFWLFSLSLYAILYTSVPHLLASYVVRILGMGWTGYVIWRTKQVEGRFERLLVEGACGVDLFPNLFRMKKVYEIPQIVLSALVFVLISYLTFRLYRTYSTKVYARVGVTDRVWKIYKMFLALFVSLQLSAFFLVTAMGLWIDQLSHGAIAAFSSFTPVYRALFICTSILLVPWVMMGWYSVRREWVRTVYAFLALGFVFIFCWGVMFYSQVYRWTFVQWPFFGCVTTASFIVLCNSFLLGILCSRHFDLGFAQFVYLDERLAKADFEPELFETDLEKVNLGRRERKSSGTSSILGALPSLDKIGR